MSAPGGAIARRDPPVFTGVPDLLAPFVAAGVFAATDVHVAATVARLAGPLDPTVLLGVALAVRATRLGHVCVVLRDVAARLVVEDTDADPVDLAGLAWPAPDRWAAALHASTVVRVIEPCDATGNVAVPTHAGGRRPLVLDDGRLYLDRYWTYEVAVADQLRARVATDNDLEHSLGWSDSGAHLSPAVDSRQRLAVTVGLERHLTVIAGGPGTGKTRTIARLLAAALEGAALEGRVLDVALAAPTGKAAARMTEAIHHEVDEVALSEPVARVLRGTEATTIHQLLGWRDGVRFRHDRHDPLTAGLVVIDEASMVSLPLMAKLLDALPRHARLVLVGDPYQLTSIEAGAVLGDVVSGAFTGAEGPLAPNVVLLDRVHRFAADSGIAALADAVREGRADAALELLRAGTSDLRWVEPHDRDARQALDDEVVMAARAVVGAALDGDAASGLAAATDLKVLAAVRRGPLSAADWQQRIEARLARAEPRARVLHQRWYAGRPVLVTRNDRLTGLVNGDTGLVVSVAGERRVAFREAEGLRWVQPSQLGSVETWWAMTVHKSQGSEYQRVVLSLPDARAPILTRELLYTAITRARASLVIVATEAALRAAVARPVTRASGLGPRLWT